MNISHMVASGLLLFPIFTAHAALLDDQLQDAANFVAETKTMSAPKPMIMPFSRFYVAGDRWLVNVTHLSRGFVRKMAEPLSETALSGAEPRYYNFRVLGVGAHGAHVAV